MNRAIYIFALLFFWIFQSCSSTKNVSNESTTTVSNPLEERVLIEANTARILGDKDKAMELYRAYLINHPNSANAAYNIGRLYFADGFYVDAYNYALKAKKNAPDNLQYSLFYVNCSFQTQHVEEAFRTYDDLLLAKPSNIELFMEYANILFQTKLYNQSIDVLHQFEQRNGSNEQILLAKNRSFYALSLKDSVYSVLQQLLVLKPYDVQYNGLLAEFYISEHQFSKANDIYNLLLNNNLADGSVYLSMANFSRIKADKSSLETFYLQAINDLNLGLNKKLSFFSLLDRDTLVSQKFLYVDVLDQLIALYPKEVKLLEYKLRYAEFLHDSHLKNYYYRKIVSLDPSKINTWYQLLEMDYSLMNYDTLYIDANRALEYFPTQGGIYFYAGVAALRLENYGESISLLETAEKYSIDNSHLLYEVYSSLCEACNYQRKYELSDIYFNRAYAIDSTQVYLLNNYAYFLSLRAEKLYFALELVNKCLSVSPDYYPFLDTKAWILFQMKNYDQAALFAEKACSNSGSEDAVILEHYADILLALGKRQLALEKYRLAYQLNLSSSLKTKIKNVEK